MKNNSLLLELIATALKFNQLLIVQRTLQFHRNIKTLLFVISLASIVALKLFQLLNLLVIQYYFFENQFLSTFF